MVNTFENPAAVTPETPPSDASKASTKPTEIGGRKDGLEPTRYGDWEKKGKCVDF